MKKTTPLLIRIAGILLFIVRFANGYSQDRTGYQDHFWKPNGTVYAMYLDDGFVDGSKRLYLGGFFDYIGPSVTYGAEINTSGTLTNPNAPAPNGEVIVAISDGAGGWYIGGSFSKIGTETRRGIAHIYSTGALDPSFNPDCNGTVYSIVYSNSSTLVLGGRFDSIGNIERKNIAMISTSGVVQSWNPGTNGAVRTMIRNTDSLLYIGGEFTLAGGQIRNRLAAMSIWSNTLTSWNPDANDIVYKLKMYGSGNVFFAAGSFTSIGGLTRNRLASFDRTVSFGSLTTFNPPSIDAPIFDFTFGTTGSIYIGGQFRSIGVTNREALAELSSSGTLTSWNPDPSSNSFTCVYALHPSTSGILVGGYFKSIGRASRNCIAEIDRVTGLATSWNPSVENTVFLITGSSKYYIGGVFESINGVSRTNAACINTLTGIPTSWDPSPDNVVLCLDMSSTTSGKKMYMGGEFERVGTISRRALASFDVISGEVSTSPNSFNANLQNPLGAVFVTAMETPDGESSLIIGGSFNSASGLSRGNLASYNINTNTINTSWNPVTDGPVYTLKSSSGSLYIGGLFTNVSGSIRNNVAAVSSTTGSLLSWNPGTNGIVKSIDLGTSGIYIGGRFTTVGGSVRNRLALVSTIGLVQPWNPTVIGDVSVINVGDYSVYIGGTFTTVAGITRNRIAELSLVSPTCNSWNPNADEPYYGDIKSIIVDRYNIYTGGQFFSMAGNVTRRNFIGLIDSTKYPSVIGPSSVCAGATNTFDLYCSVNTGASAFTWTSSPTSGVTISGTSQTTKSIKFTTAGNYNITITPSNGHPPITYSVLVRPLPTSGTITGPSPICSGGTATFTINSMLNATSYNWSAPAGATLLSSSGTSATYQFGTAASYTISVTGSNNGCVASAPRTRAVSTALPPTGGSISGLSSICQTSASLYSITGMTNTSASTTYTWSATNGATLSGTGTSRTITFPNAGSSTITVQTANGGCNGTTLSRTVTVNPAPTATYSISGTSSACEGTAATFTTTTTSGVNYNWSLSPSTAGTLTSSGSSTTVTFNGSYTSGATAVTLRMVPSIGSCSKTASTKSVTVNKYPISPTLSTPVQACSSALFTCTASATYATSYTWSISKALNVGTGTGPSRTVTMGASAVTVKVTPKNGNCSGTQLTRTVNRQLTGCPLFREDEPAASEIADGEILLSAFPNPASDQISLRILGLKEAESFKFHWYDLSGKLVKSEHPAQLESGSEIILYRNELPAGIYHLRLEGEQTQLHTRVIFE